ncbi:hypothetical protein J6590_069417 [Homalodisca vitripennis]|nr:hypothetical protein J6590_069417 [Homalodisca vitripennis]
MTAEKQVRDTCASERGREETRGDLCVGLPVLIVGMHFVRGRTLVQDDARPPLATPTLVKQQPRRDVATQRTARLAYLGTRVKRRAERSSKSDKTRNSGR